MMLNHPGRRLFEVSSQSLCLSLSLPVVCLAWKPACCVPFAIHSLKYQATKEGRRASPLTCLILLLLHGYRKMSTHHFTISTFPDWCSGQHFGFSSSSRLLEVFRSRGFDSLIGRFFLPHSSIPLKTLGSYSCGLVFCFLLSSMGNNIKASYKALPLQPLVIQQLVEGEHLRCVFYCLVFSSYGQDARGMGLDVAETG
jgi:hypothetical protein